MSNHDERPCLARDTPGRSLFLDDFLSGLRSERSDGWQCGLGQNEGVDHVRDRTDCSHASLLAHQSGWRCVYSLACTSWTNPTNVANERWSTAGNNETDRERKSGKTVEWFRRSGLQRMLSSTGEVEIQKSRKRKVCTSGGLIVGILEKSKRRQ
jgi:hypothetical protein